MNNEGFEFISDRVPAPYSGLIRGMLLRGFLLAKALRLSSFKVWYPLPAVVSFESEVKASLGSNFPVVVLKQSQSIGLLSRSLPGLAALGIKITNQAKLLYLWMRTLVTRQPTVIVLLVDLEQGLRKNLESAVQHLEDLVGSRVKNRAFVSPLRYGAFCVLVVSDTAREETRFVRRHEAKTSLGPAIILIESHAQNPREDPYPLPAGAPKLRISLRDEVLKLALTHGKRPRPPLVQVPDNRAAISILSSSRLERFFSQRSWYFGIGDVLMGAALVYEEAKHSGRLAHVDWERVIGKEYLARPDHGAHSRRRKLFASRGKEFQISRQINTDFPVDFAFQEYVFTNRRPARPFGDGLRSFLYEAFSPVPEVWREAHDYLLQNHLVAGQYSVVHIRFGDHTTRKSEITESLLRETSKLLELDCDFVLLSDDPQMLEGFLGSEKVLVRNHAGGHSGQVTDGSVFREMLLDFLTIAYSQECYSLSRYAWGSAFAEVACEIFGVPLRPVVRKDVTDSSLQ